MKLRPLVIVAFAWAILLPGVTLAADTTYKCKGVARKQGSASERNFGYELEFFWTAGVYRMFTYPGGVRKKVSEGPADRDNSEIHWGSGNVIDLSSGQMVREGKSKDGTAWTEYATCVRRSS